MSSTTGQCGKSRHARPMCITIHNNLLVVVKAEAIGTSILYFLIHAFLPHSRVVLHALQPWGYSMYLFVWCPAARAEGLIDSRCSTFAGLRCTRCISKRFSQPSDDIVWDLVRCWHQGYPCVTLQIGSQPHRE